MTDPLPTLAIIGGTGALGGGLAQRWAHAGYPVVIGSRSAEKAGDVAAGLTTGGGAPPVLLEATQEAALQVVRADDLAAHAIDAG